MIRGRGRSDEERLAGARIERLLCDFRLDADVVDEQDRAALNELNALGLIEDEGDALTVTPAGRPYVRNIAARLDPAFITGTQRHSVAV